MYDYGRLVFLDNQKTGSTYVSIFLKECCTLPLVKSMKHHPIRGDYRSNTIYFSTVRNPVDLYISLFRYGQDRKGITYKRLKALKLLHLYKDMPEWLDFVLDEGNAAIFQEGYNQISPLGIGLMSFRAMRITLRHPIKTMARAKSHDQLVRIWEKKRIAAYIFKQENLNEKLYHFSTEIVPQFFDRDRVENFLQTSDRVNASVSGASCSIPGELLQKIEEKERFLINSFYTSEVGQERTRQIGTKR
ncbi:hypothetical protein [Paracoccus sp. (in: a-proteobacteria)]|uniref:hypothetical protein n=1 Tax=Paracoccus sp. TaxID=267 RepID=UPI004058C1F3